MDIQTDSKKEFPMTTRKIWTREDIDAMLMTNDDAVMRAIVRLFEMQTADEQSSADTKRKNNRGFSAADAKAGTRMARWLLGLNDSNERRYVQKSLNHPMCYRVLGRYTKKGETVMNRARRIALKHSAQLVKIANS